MCFDLDSVPPITPIEGGAVDHRDLELESDDGNRFSAFAALPEEPSDVGVVIIPDVRGFYRFYEELALRFAERGTAAIAIDFYGRTAGVGKRGDDFDYPAHRAQTTRKASSPTCTPAWSGCGSRGAARSSRSASASAAGTRGSLRRGVTA